MKAVVMPHILHVSLKKSRYEFLYFRVFSGLLHSDALMLVKMLLGNIPHLKKQKERPSHYSEPPSR